MEAKSFLLSYVSQQQNCEIQIKNQQNDNIILSKRSTYVFAQKNY